MAIKSKEKQIARIQKELNTETKRIERYKKGLEKNEHGQYREIENVAKKLDEYKRKGYITKSGTIRKSISQKKLEEINTYFSATFRNKKSSYNQVKTVKARTQTRRHIAYNLAKKWDMSEKEAKNYIKTMTKIQNDSLFELLGYDSEQVRVLMETNEDITFDTIKTVSEYLLNDKAKNTPEIMQKYTGQDDYFEALTDIIAKVENLDDRLKHEDIERILYDEGFFEEDEEGDFI